MLGYIVMVTDDNGGRIKLKDADGKLVLLDNNYEAACEYTDRLRAENPACQATPIKVMRPLSLQK